MLKKIFIVFLLLLLCACQRDTAEPETIVNDEEYIEAAREVLIFSELDQKLQERIRKANAGQEYRNYQFAMWGKKVYEKPLYDIYGNEVILRDLDTFVMEIVSVECSHCRKQLHVLNDYLDSCEVPFIQYFNVGDPSSIRELYAEEGIAIPEDVIIISRDESLADYVRYEVELRSYPGILCYRNSEICFDAYGEVDAEGFEELLKLAFTDQIGRDDLRDAEGRDLMKLNRSIEDLKNDLSPENIARLEALDNDDYTCELTYQLMGNRVDLTATQKDDPVYVNEVGDFAYYNDKKLVIFYTYLRDNSETKKVEFINSLISADDEYEYLVVLVEGLESSSAALRNMSVSFDCPAVSILSSLPDDFYSFGLAAYPTAVFIDRGVFTGAYSKILGTEEFKEALDLFLSDNCIAYKRNNQMSKG